MLDITILDIPWILFIATSLAVIMSPGQDLILVMSRGLGQGSKAGVIAALGVSTGLMGLYWFRRNSNHLRICFHDPEIYRYDLFALYRYTSIFFWGTKT